MSSGQTASVPDCPLASEAPLTCSVSEKSEVPIRWVTSPNQPSTCKTETYEIYSSLPSESTRTPRVRALISSVLVAQTIVEHQLKDRQIPYTLRYPASTSSLHGSSSVVSRMVPTLVIRSADLLKDGRAMDVAMPNVFMQITDWWKGQKCQVSGPAVDDGKD